MSASARWTIAIVGALCAVSFAAVAVTLPPGVMNRAGLWIMAGFCSLLVVACFPGRFRETAIRLLGASICVCYVGYVLSEIGQPVPSWHNYWRGGTNIVNGVLGFLVFGLPGGLVALFGWPPGKQSLEPTVYPQQPPPYKQRTVRYRPSSSTKARETRTLLARRHLLEVGAEGFVDWAVSLLEAGLDTQHLRMLASLGPHPDTQDVEYYFGQTMGELGWAILTPVQAIRQYARDIAQDILDGTLSASEGAANIYRLYHALNLPQDMQGWLYLCDDLDPDTHQDLEGEAWEYAVRREARRLLNWKASPLLFE